MHKGIMLAGGLGTRLQPLTKITSKHLLPVGNEPMIFHSVKQLTEAGITDILIVTNPQYKGGPGPRTLWGGRFQRRSTDRRY